MSRKMSPEREQEYAELHAYLDYYSTNISGIDPADPVRTIGDRPRICLQSQVLAGCSRSANRKLVFRKSGYGDTVQTNRVGLD